MCEMAEFFWLVALDLMPANLSKCSFYSLRETLIVENHGGSFEKMQLMEVVTAFFADPAASRSVTPRSWVITAHDH